MIRRIAKVNAIGGPTAMLSAVRNIQGLSTYKQMIESICKYNPPANNIAQHFSDGTLHMEDFFHDLYPLQNLWAREQKFALGLRRYSQTKILLEQLRRGTFDCILFQGSLPKFEAEEFIKFRRQNPSISLVIAHVGHKHDRQHLQGVDLVLGANQELSDWYKGLGFQSETLWHSFDESVLNQIRIPKWDEKHGFCFAGSSGYGLDSHKRRYQVLKEVIERIPGNYFLEENNPIVLPRRLSFSDRSLKYELKVRINSVKKNLVPDNARPKKSIIQLSSLYPNFVRSEVYGVQMYQLLAQAKMTLQIHQSAATSAGALRIFEATGLGVCLITDGDNFDPLFNPNSDLVRLRHHSDVVEVIEALLKNDPLIRKTAEAGRRRTLKAHTSLIRSKEFKAILDRVS